MVRDFPCPGTRAMRERASFELSKEAVAHVVVRTPSFRSLHCRGGRAQARPYVARRGWSRFHPEPFMASPDANEGTYPARVEGRVRTRPRECRGPHASSCPGSPTF